MPIFDPVEQRMAVRIVYDGVAFAGKTTNLRQLCTLFAAQRQSDLHSPADLRGRTLYFDWMNIAAGVVCGFPLLCQVISVPGQVVLTPRRRHLLATADVVIYVCESGESASGAARAGLALYDEVARERGTAVPLLIQANKQDQLGALDGATLLCALGRPDAQVTEAIASEGVGVVDTFVAAVRMVARSLKDRSDSDALRIEVRRAQTAGEVLALLGKEQIDPEWAAEMLLEEAQAALMLEEAFTTVAADAAVRAAAASAAEDLTRIERIVAPSTSAQAPAAPSADVPTGFIWPAHTGRAAVRALGLDGATVPPFAKDGVVVLRAFDHLARTSVRAHFPDGESARQALVRGARECTQLDRLLVPETVLVAQPAGAGGCWIWTVRPDIPSLDALLRGGQAAPDLIAGYVSALVEALRTSLRHGLSVDLAPSSFGVQQGMLRYIGELSADVPSADRLSSSIIAAVEVLDLAGVDVSTFLDAFERELRGKLTVEEHARASLSIPDRLYAGRGRVTQDP